MYRLKLARIPSIFKNCLRTYHGKTNLLKDGKTVDLRSDTVTKPSSGMLQAMFDAKVGDDVYKEDETVNKLEKMAADLFGMESALFVPSGTMGNLICLMVHCDGRGEEFIIGANQHVYCYEQGHFMQLGSIAARVLPNKPDGTLCIEEVASKINDGSDFHCCKTKLICLENTYMKAGGIPLSVDYLHQVGDLAHSNNVSIHVDGARLYNAAVSLNCEVSNLLVPVDSVSMCLSKGLGCPVGSVIGGTKFFIERAKRIRKSLGGGMRQSGYLAAAGIYALEQAPAVLFDDHIRASRLANGIKDLRCPRIIDVDLESVQSNMIFVKTPKGMATKIVEALGENGVLCGAFDSTTIRFVTHLDVGDDDVSYTLSSLEHVVESLSRVSNIS